MKKIVLAFALLALTAWLAQAQFLLPWRQAVWANLQQQKQQSPQTDPNLLAALNQQSQQTAQMLGYLQALAAQQQSAAAPQYQIAAPPQGPSINYHYHYWMSGPPSGGSTPVYPPAQPQGTPQTPAPAQPIINVVPAQPQPQTAPQCPPHQAPQAPANPQQIFILPAPTQPSAPIINIPAPGQPQIAIPAPPAQPQIQIPAPPAQPQIVIPPPASPRIQIPPPGNTPGIPIPAPGSAKPATAMQRYTQTPAMRPRPPALYESGRRVYQWQPAVRK